MSEDLQGIGAVPAGTGPDKPSESEGVTVRDLTQLPEFRAYQSKVDRERENWRRERAALEERLRELAQQVDELRAEQEVYRSALQLEDDEERRRVFEAARSQAHMQRLIKENEELRRRLAEQQEREEFIAYHKGMAARIGLNPNDPTLMAAIEMALESGDPTIIEVTKAEMIRRSSAPQTSSPLPRSEPAPAQMGIAPIPATSAQPMSQAERERRRKEYYEKKLQLPQGNVAEHARLRALYRDVLDEDEW